MEDSGKGTFADGPLSYRHENDLHGQLYLVMKTTTDSKSSIEDLRFEKANGKTMMWRTYKQAKIREADEYWLNPDL